MGKVFLRKGIGMSPVKVKVGRIPLWLAMRPAQSEFSNQKTRAMLCIHPVGA